MLPGGAMLATQMPDTQVEAKDVKQVKQKDLNSW